MEEVDSILMRQLREIGCELDDEINSLKELEVHQILNCVLHCLSLIYANNANSVELPQKCIDQSMNMSVKYKIAAQLAIICKQLGYKADIGYQTFLYGNESDIRKLLLFLLECLPKEDTAFSSVVSSNNLIDEIKKLKINTVWSLPKPINSENTNQQNCMVVNMSMYNNLSVKSVLINKVAPNKRNFYDHFLKMPRNLMSITEWNCLRLNYTDSLLLLKSKHVSIQNINNNSEKIVIDLNKKVLNTLPVSKNVDSYVNNENECELKDEKVNDLNICDDENSDLVSVSTIEALKLELSEYTKQILKYRTHEEHLKNYETMFQEEYLHLRQLQASDKTKSEFQSQINELKSEIESMSEQWQQIQNQLSDQLMQLQNESKAKNEITVATHKQLNELKKSLTSKKKEIKSKEALISEMITKLPQQWPPSRSSYTKRILEIISNVKKQNNETKKVLFETRGLQKEINGLSGKLSRTFTVADEEIFREAKTNEWNRRCYKLLASLHEHCDLLLEAVNNIGIILREIRQLEESVETERSRKTSSNLTRILADLSQIKLENEHLTAKLTVHS